MYKILFTFVFSFGLFLIANSQNMQYSNFIEFHENTLFNRAYNAVDTYALKLKVKSIQLTIKEGNKKQKYNLQEMFFDNNGRANVYYSYVDTFKSKIKIKASSTFNDKNSLINEMYDDGSYGFMAVSSYNDSNLLAERCVYNMKNKLTSKRVYSYHSGGLINRLNFYNDKNKLISSYKYTYYPDGKLKQTVFKRKKKTKIWDYTCDETGKTLDKAKDTIKVCTTKSYLSDGKIVSTTQGYNWNGTPYKYVSISDTFNNIIEVAYYETIKDIIVYKEVNTYEGNIQVSRNYESYIKGKLYYKSETNKDKNGRVVKSSSQFFSKNKPKVSFSNEYQYYSNGLIAKKTYLKNNVAYKQGEYQYNFYQ